ncbi:MAG: FAD-dependent oxidoreductase [Candidatus Berkiellales bacterium]
MTQHSDSPIVIIGTGLAGYSLAKELRKIDKTQNLVLITQDAGHFYSKPQLSTALNQAKSPQELIITSKEKMESQLEAKIYAHTTVTAIDTARQSITFHSPTGTHELHFSKLVFANGASPKPLTIFDDIHHHYRINSLQDYDHFITQLKQWEKLIIIGSGLVGCEFAHDLLASGIQITVVTPDPYPLLGLVPAPIGQALQQALMRKGVIWHTQALLKEVINNNHHQHHNNHQHHLHLSNGNSLTADAVLSAIGLQPNIALAHQAKINVRNGIVVNDYLQTNHSAIFALGDCAEIKGICRQYISPILLCSKALAQTLCGNPTPVMLPSTPITLKVDAYPIITYPVPKDIKGEWQIDQNAQDFKALFYDTKGQLQGYTLSGSFLEYRQTCLQALNTNPAIA